MNALHKRKVELGTVVTIIIFMVGCTFGIIKWYKKTDSNIKEIKTIAKENKKDIENLSKCERKASESIIQIRTLLNSMDERIGRLEQE